MFPKDLQYSRFTNMISIHDNIINDFATQDYHDVVNYIVESTLYKQ